MRKLFRFTSLLFLFLGIVLYSCNNVQKEKKPLGETVEITHKLGKTKVTKNPTLIVTLDIGALETLQELDVKPVAVPKKHLPKYLDYIQNDNSIGDAGLVIEPNLEAINEYDPDLILISTRQERYYDELSKIAPTVYIGTNTDDYLNSFKENTLLIGRLVGKEHQVEEKLDQLFSKINQAQEKFKKDSNKALFLIYNNGNYNAFGKASRFGFIHDVLLLNPVLETTNTSVHGRIVSNELIAESNPDYLFIVDRNAAVYGRDANKSEVVNKLIQQTNAYKNDKIFYLDPHVWFISGGGLISVEMMVDDIVSLLDEE